MGSPSRRSPPAVGPLRIPLITQSNPAEPVPPVHDQFEALGRRHNAKIGVYAVVEKTGRSISYLDGERFAVCSTFKGYAAARVLQKAGRGELNLDEAVFVDPAAVVANSPITDHRSGGRSHFAAE